MFANALIDTFKTFPSKNKFGFQCGFVRYELNITGSIIGFI